MRILEHFGVYAVCVKNNKLLCIHKNRGPYKGRYDLPGGSLENGESLLDALRREIDEETEYSISKIYSNSVFDIFVNINESERVHHIFGLYIVDLIKKEYTKDIQAIIGGKEINDSIGTEWVSLNDLCDKNASPLILKVLDIKEDFEGKYYKNWEIY